MFLNKVGFIYLTYAPKVSDMKNSIVTRFAPSPSGFLHLGHIASALYVWGIAKSKNAKILLRIEDHDQQRSREKYVEAIFEDLQWLGLAPDLGFVTLNHSNKVKYLQSARHTLYQEYTEKLVKQGIVYKCNCSRKAIVERQKPNPFSDELVYDGYCRGRQEKITQNYGLRICLPQKEVLFKDQVMGLQRQIPYLQCGDLLIRDKHQNWTYNYAVTIDDIEQNINLIIRGQDILPATGRQLLLRELLNSENYPEFYHHPLIMDDSTGIKLSKKEFAISIQELKLQGKTKEELIGQAANLVGLIPELRSLTLPEALELFGRI